VINPVSYEISPSVKRGLDSADVSTNEILGLVGERFVTTKDFKDALMERRAYSNKQLYAIFQYALIDSFRIDSAIALSGIDTTILTGANRDSLKAAHGLTFRHRFDFLSFLQQRNIIAPPGEDKLLEKRREHSILLLEETFRVRPPGR
jgi:hypothetical protein